MKNTEFIARCVEWIVGQMTPEGSAKAWRWREVYMEVTNGGQMSQRCDADDYHRHLRKMFPQVRELCEINYGLGLIKVAMPLFRWTKTSELPFVPPVEARSGNSEQQVYRESLPSGKYPSVGIAAFPNGCTDHPLLLLWQARNKARTVSTVRNTRDRESRLLLNRQMSLEHAEQTATALSDLTGAVEKQVQCIE